MRVLLERPAGGVVAATPAKSRGAGGRTAVLLLTRDAAAAERDLDRLLPGRAILPVRREEIRGLGPAALAGRLRRFCADEIVILVDDLHAQEAVGKLLALLALPLAPRRFLLDRAGRRRPVSASRFVGRDLPWLLAGWTASRLALLRTRARLRRLAKSARRVPTPVAARKFTYLRSELWTGIAAGGSVGHSAGLLSGLLAQNCEVDVVATARPAMLDDTRHALHLVPPLRIYTACRELPAVAHSLVFESAAARFLARRTPGVLYQRFDPAGHAGVALSRALDRPLVLEYNGPEVWIADHWGRSYRRRGLFEAIERVNLRHADLVSVVSRALCDHLVSQGVARERIVVLPNAVDPALYRPDLDGRSVRRRLGIDEGATVIGFIGTFQPWHGAIVLARAAVQILRDRPRAVLLFVGDGPGRADCEAVLRDSGCRDRAIFPGLVPQREGPAHLAAMDILVASHVPNPDGSRFFGSPTKLFEYMAMGKGIVASRLEQIAEVLEDGRTALLVPPDDVTALARALGRLADDRALRAELGTAARLRSVERHTWAAHARDLIARLSSMGLVSWS